MKKFLILVVALVSLTACTNPPPVISSNGIIIISVNNGTKIVKFSNGNTYCFDRFGQVCPIFNSKMIVVQSNLAQIR